MQTVSEAYILGIREGREYLTNHPETTLDDMRAHLDNCKSTLRRGFSGDVAEMLRGERDFWATQIKVKGIMPRQKESA